MSLEVEIISSCNRIRVLLAVVLLTLCIGCGASAKAAKLEPGESGRLVEALQKRLQKKGFYDNAEITGFYGIVTEQSVRRFQAKNELKQDGIAGDQTLKKLFGSTYSEMFGEKEGGKATATPKSTQKSKNSTATPTPKVKATAKSTSTRTSEDGSVLYAGCENDDVKDLQKRLKKLGYYTEDKATGYYGPATEKAVMRFQSANGIEADGIAGVETRKLISSSKAVAAKGTGTGTGTGTETKASSSGTKASGSGEETKGSSSSGGGSVADDIIQYAKKYLGTSYKYGASGPDAFDCSGFTTYVFKHYGVSLDRTSASQGYGRGTKIESIGSLKKGDLVFFDTTGTSDRCGHVGIYIGDGSFIHCSSSSSGKYVRISTLSSGYYNDRFSWARRVL